MTKFEDLILASHTFQTTPDIEEKWKKYEKLNPDVIFSKMAKNAVLEYLNKKLKSKK